MNVSLKDIIKFVAVVAATVGIATGILTIVDWFTDDELTIEQRLSPEMMEELKKSGGTIKIEKGITIEREDDDTGS